MAEVGKTAKALALVRTFVQLGRALGVEMVAEGIETEVQRSVLTQERVETGQGFLFARPLEPAAVEQFLRQAPHFAAEPVGV